MLKGLVWLLLFCHLSGATGQENDAEKKQLVDELIELTEVKQVVPSLSNYWAQLFIQTASKQMPVNDKLRQKIFNTTHIVVDHKLIENNALLDIVYPFYNDKFSREELSRMVAFYRSPTGMKSVHYMPIDHTELQEFIQQHQGELQTEIARQVQNMIETAQ